MGASEWVGHDKKVKTVPFDPKVFLATANGGRTLSKYLPQSESADAVFYLQKGQVKITVVSEQGKEAVVAVLIGGGAESFDTNGLHFQKLSSDLFRAVLGLGAGDLKATASGERGATIESPNVIFVDRKVHGIEGLISVKPERTS